MGRSRKQAGMEIGRGRKQAGQGKTRKGKAINKEDKEEKITEN